MLEPFPDEIDVPYGMVHTRMPLGVPAWAFGLLFVLGVTPLYLFGLRAWWMSVIALVLGMGIAAMAKDDPQFLKAWSGEIRLKDYYD